jgi:hypothetical protein
LSVKFPTNNTAAGKRGRLSLLASTEEVKDKRQHAMARKVTSLSALIFLIVGSPRPNDVLIFSLLQRLIR